MTDEVIEKDTLETETELGTPESPEAEKPEDKSKELQSALAQKEHFRKKAEEAEAKLALKVKEPEGNLSQSGPENPVGQNPLEVVRLAKALGGYDDEETQFIIRNAEDKSPDGIIKASQDKWVQTAIKAKREEVEIEKQTPPPSSPLGVFEQPKNPDDMPIKEKEEFFRGPQGKKLVSDSFSALRKKFDK